MRSPRPPLSWSRQLRWESSHGIETSARWLETSTLLGGGRPFSRQTVRCQSVGRRSSTAGMPWHHRVSRRKKTGWLLRTGPSPAGKTIPHDVRTHWTMREAQGRTHSNRRDARETAAASGRTSDLAAVGGIEGMVRWPLPRDYWLVRYEMHPSLPAATNGGLCPGCAYMSQLRYRRQTRRNRVWSGWWHGGAAEVSVCCDPHHTYEVRATHFSTFRELKHLWRKILKCGLYVKRLSNRTPRNLAVDSVGIDCPYSWILRWGSEQWRRQKWTVTVFVVEKRRPFSVLQRSRRATASCSWRDTARILEAEYRTARSSTNRDLSMAGGAGRRCH